MQASFYTESIQFTAGVKWKSCPHNFSFLIHDYRRGLTSLKLSEREIRSADKASDKQDGKNHTSKKIDFPLLGKKNYYTEV